MSPDLRRIIDEAGGRAEVVWHEMSIIVDGRGKQYYAPRFVGVPDLINRKRSKIVNGPIGEAIIKAVFSIDKVADRVFSLCRDPSKD